MNIIAGKYRGRKLSFPKHETKLRPTKNIMREAVFNILQNEISGARFLDVYAGTGAMGLEAISRGAHEVLFVDINTSWISQNLKLLDLTAFVLKSEARKALLQLEKHEKCFDVIWLDPPYNAPDLDSILQTYFESSILVEQGLMLFEHSPSLQIPADILKFRTKERRFGNSCLSVFKKGAS